MGIEVPNDKFQDWSKTSAEDKIHVNLNVNQKQKICFGWVIFFNLNIFYSVY